ncbi:hypothetical protein WA158_008542 [Blastocystis sp. Blastoise]
MTVSVLKNRFFFVKDQIIMDVELNSVALADLVDAEKNKKATEKATTDVQPQVQQTNTNNRRNMRNTSNGQPRRNQRRNINNTTNQNNNLNQNNQNGRMTRQTPGRRFSRPVRNSNMNSIPRRPINTRNVVPVSSRPVPTFHRTIKKNNNTFRNQERHITRVIPNRAPAQRVVSVLKHKQIREPIFQLPPGAQVKVTFPNEKAIVPNRSHVSRRPVNRNFNRRNNPTN